MQNNTTISEQYFEDFNNSYDFIRAIYELAREEDSDLGEIDLGNIFSYKEESDDLVIETYTGKDISLYQVCYNRPLGISKDILFQDVYVTTIERDKDGNSIDDDREYDEIRTESNGNYYPDQSKSVEENVRILLSKL